MSTRSVNRLNAAAALVQSTLNKLLTVNPHISFKIEVKWSIETLNDTDELVPLILVETK